MSNFDEFLTMFETMIEERFNKYYSTLTKSNKWKEAYSEHTLLYDQFFEQLNEKMQKDFEELYSAFHNLNSLDIYFAYQRGFIDGIFIKESFDKH